MLPPIRIHHCLIERPTRQVVHHQVGDAVLLAGVGLGQSGMQNGEQVEEPAIVTLGNALDGIRRLSRNGQTPYWVHDVVTDILGQE